MNEEGLTNKETEMIQMNDFIAGYQKLFGVELKIIDSDRENPDFEVEDPISTEKFGVEITGLYESEYLANLQKGKIKEWDSISGSGEVLLSRLYERLACKACSSYKSEYNGELVLAIWNGSLMLNERFDIDFIRPKIVIPVSKFSKIWLIIKNRADNKPELYPF